MAWVGNETEESRRITLMNMSTGVWMPSRFRIFWLLISFGHLFPCIPSTLACDMWEQTIGRRQWVSKLKRLVARCRSQSEDIDGEIQRRIKSLQQNKIARWNRSTFPLRRITYSKTISMALYFVSAERILWIYLPSLWVFAPEANVIHLQEPESKDYVP